MTSKIVAGAQAARSSGCGTYANRGGFLETNGSSSADGARYDVDTNAYSNRGNTNVTLWKILPAT